MHGSSRLIAAVPALVMLIAVAGRALGPRTGLTVAGVALGGLTAVALTMVLGERGWVSRVKAAPRLLAVGLLLFSLATALGTVVGAFRANPLSYWLGQVLAMALIPAWALVGLAVREGFPLRAFARCLSGVMAGYAACGLAVWAVDIARGAGVGRIPFGVTGASLLGLLVSISLLLHDQPFRAVARAAVALIALAMVGSGGRSLLAVAVVSCGALILLLRPRRWPEPRWVLSALALVLLLLAGGIGARRWWLAVRPNVLDASLRGAPIGVTDQAGGMAPPAPANAPGPAIHLEQTDRPPSTTVASFGAEQPGWYRLRASVSGQGAGWIYLAIIWQGSEGQDLGRFGEYRGAGRGSAGITAAGRRPDGASRALVVATSSEGGGPWEIDSVRVERLESAALARLCETTRKVFTRPPVVASAEQESAVLDPSLSFRLSETAALWSEIKSRSIAANAFGSGLGAVFSFKSFIAGDDDRVAVGSRTNYIHNYYMFLLFKLGIAGTILVLAALILWLAWTAQASRLATTRSGRAFATAAGCAWLGYGAWALVAPAILDPRLAPLLGLCLAGVAAVPPAPRRAPLAPWSPATE